MATLAKAMTYPTRIAILDSKAFDNTPLQDAKYNERSLQIAQETLFVFSNIQ